MKLAAQYNRASMLITVSILIIGGLIYYFTIDYITNQQLDRDLGEELVEVTEYVDAHQQLYPEVYFDNNEVRFTKSDGQNIKRHFDDAVFVDPKTKKPEAGRAIIQGITVKGVNYQVILTESKQGVADLVQIIGLITAILTLLLLIALFFTNRFILNGLWKPFYELLQRLQSFNLNNADTGYNKPISIEEFNELNVAIDHMAQRSRNDYQSLKAFTENASHEMMTPIAVITSKLDNMIQDENLDGVFLEQLQDIFQATNKLSRLNQSLLLLVKIDNQLMKDIAPIDLKHAVEEKLKQFNELMKGKNLTVTKTLADKTIAASAYLTEALLNNLISNAIRHNINGGKIQVILTENQLVIANTGAPLPLDAGLVFERFQKGRSSEGLGLGLTIARNICESYNFSLNYVYQNDKHQFIIKF